jgi:hypothetical protein
LEKYQRSQQCDSRVIARRAALDASSAVGVQLVARTSDTPARDVRALAYHRAITPRTFPEGEMPGVFASSQGRAARASSSGANIRACEYARAMRRSAIAK